MGLNRLGAGDGTLDGILLTIGLGIIVQGVSCAIRAVQDLQAGLPVPDTLAGTGGAALGLFLVGGTMAAKAAHNLYASWQSYQLARTAFKAEKKPYMSLARIFGL